MKHIKSKCWIEEEGEKFYGPGPNELLRKIQQEGSLSKAAGQMNMSYKKAWEIIRRLNQHAQEPLVILRKGGEHGGGAQLTAHALEIVEKYDHLQEQIRELLDQQKALLRF